MTDTIPAPDTAPDIFVPPNTDPRWAALAAPFPADEIEKLPKQISRDDRDKYQCRPGTKASADGFHCGGYHARSIHLDYVGHAGVTTRLNAVDPTWTWEPMYRDVPNDILLAAINTGNENIVRQVIANAPMMFTQGGLWIRLTVLGVTRPGFGDASGKNGPDAVKELIGDAIRNAGMRFGVATYLWSKSAKARAAHPDSDDDARTPSAPPRREGTPLGERVDHQRDDLAARRAGEFDHRSPEGRREIARSAAAVAVNGHAPGQVPPPADNEPVSVAGARAVERAQQQRAADRAAQQAQRPQQPRREPERPAPRKAPSGDPDTAALIEAIVHATRADHLRNLWAQGASVQPAGRDSDVRSYLDEPTLTVLAPLLDAIPVDAQGPIKLGHLLVVANKHLDAEGGMSIHDHIAADEAVIDPATGRSVTPPADAVPAR